MKSTKQKVFILVTQSWRKEIMHNTCIFLFFEAPLILEFNFYFSFPLLLQQYQCNIYFPSVYAIEPSFVEWCWQYFSWGLCGVTTSQHLEKENLIECRCMGGVLNVRWHCFSGPLNMIVDASSWTFLFCSGLY